MMFWERVVYRFGCFGFGAGESAVPPPAQAQSGSVWQQVYSEEYRRHYYWNTDRPRCTGSFGLGLFWSVILWQETNATQWEQPQNFTPAS